MIEARGIAGVPGLTIGPILQIRATDAHAHTSFVALRDRALHELEILAERLRGTAMESEAAIFDAQAMLIVDPALEYAVTRRMEQGYTLTDAITGALAELVAEMEAFPEANLRDRAADIRAVAALLLSDGIEAPAEIAPGTILIASELAPSDLLKFPVAQIGGIATARGSATDHTAILARSLQIPAVLGAGDAITLQPDGLAAILDGTAALLICGPDAATLARYEEHQQAAATAIPAPGADLPSETHDGQHITLMANIGSPLEIPAVLAAGAEGIGLFRTEFLFLGRATAPTEDEQYRIYRDVLQQMGDRPVVMRALDIGGDKLPSYLPRVHEANPALGERGIRFLRRYPEQFRTQLRAFMRAAVVGNLQVMVPMIATLDDVTWAREQFALAARSLQTDGIEHRADLPLGIMIETPAAAVMAERMAEVADFFSIGSNDLAQYALAADRTLVGFAQKYRHNDPAIFRLISMVRVAVDDKDMPISVCGELAADPDCAEALIGLGIDSLSMVPSAIVAVKNRIRATTVSAARAVARVASGEQEA